MMISSPNEATDSPKILAAEDDEKTTSQLGEDECPDIFADSPVLTIPSMTPKFIGCQNRALHQSPPVNNMKDRLKPPELEQWDDLSMDLKANYRATKNRSNILLDLDSPFIGPRVFVDPVNLWLSNKIKSSKKSLNLPEEDRSQFSNSDLDSPVIIRDGSQIKMIYNKHFLD